MGIYESKCSKCDKPFSWFSGNKHQLCGSCINEMGGGVFEVKRRFKNPKNSHVGCYYFIGFNEADSYEDAIKLLIERGVPEDEIIKNGDI